MKIPDAKAVVDKEWEKLEKLLAVIKEAHKEGRTVHFAENRVRRAHSEKLYRTNSVCCVRWASRQE